MSFRDIWTVAKKELKAGFTDKLILLQIIFMPFVIVFGYAFLMVIMGEASEGSESENEPKAYYVNAPEYMVEGLDELKLQKANLDMVDDLKKDIKNKECELVIVFPEGFVMSDGTSDELSNIEIWYNSTSSKSYKLFNDINMYFTALQPKLFSVNAMEDIDYDMGDEDAALRDLLAGLMPIMLLMGVYIFHICLAWKMRAGFHTRSPVFNRKTGQIVNKCDTVRVPHSYCRYDKLLVFNGNRHGYSRSLS